MGTPVAVERAPIFMWPCYPLDSGVGQGFLMNP
jgi:hypothetical protein